MAKLKKKTKNVSKITPRMVSSPAPTFWSEIPRVGLDVAFRLGLDGNLSIIKLSKDDVYFTLDHLAKEIWMSIDGVQSWQEIEASIFRRFKPPVPKFRRDFVKLVRNLENHKLIDVGPFKGRAKKTLF